MGSCCLAKQNIVIVKISLYLYNDINFITVLVLFNAIHILHIIHCNCKLNYAYYEMLIVVCII